MLSIYSLSRIADFFSSLQKNTVLVFLFALLTLQAASSEKKYLIDESSSYYVNLETWEDAPNGGDTIFIAADRVSPLRFQFITGDQQSPVVVINYGGQVNIDGKNTWGAVTFENCRYIKFSGAGHEDYKYGFKLAAYQCGLGFTELSSDCEAEFIKISHDGFFGIMAKKDYGGYPPSPIPVFYNLLIHDCFIENATEGMYLGETKSPGMEFRHVKIYNNIVRNTGREAIQIANMVEDVEIYNNTLIKAGQDGENQQNNILQIGDNCVANVYNNIMQDAPGCGIIAFGKGNNIFTNNYIGLCKGLFVDNRKFTDLDSLIEISGNYFDDNIDRGWIVRNMNEYNSFVIKDNVWDTDFTFYHNDSGNDDNYVLENNTNTPVATLTFSDVANNDYAVALGNPSAYKELGAPGGPEYFGTDDGDESNLIIEQIILNPEMIVDEVSGGSFWAASYLVDEQNLTPDSEQHPTSQSWKPFWNMDKAPYNVYIDLGTEYLLTTVALHDMHNTKNLDISIGTPGDWEPLFTEPCDKYNTWKQHDVSVATRYLRLSMNESVYAAVNELILYGSRLEEMEAPQIVLNTEMLVDELEGGSYWSADYLVDEQSITPESELHPISQSWKPFWNMDKGPYHFYIDLGKYYQLTEIAIHDMNNSKPLEISVGEPDNWTGLITENCDKYNTWKAHEVAVSTRYLRVSMLESVFAAVNEIILYGFEEEEIMQEKSASISKNVEIWEPEEFQEEIEQLVLVQNPVLDKLELYIPSELNEKFTIEVFNLNGAMIFGKCYNRSSTSKLRVNIAEEKMNEGMHILRYSNANGYSKNIKFIKKHF